MSRVPESSGAPATPNGAVTSGKESSGAPATPNGAVTSGKATMDHNISIVKPEDGKATKSIPWGSSWGLPEDGSCSSHYNSSSHSEGDVRTFFPLGLSMSLFHSTGSHC